MSAKLAMSIVTLRPVRRHLLGLAAALLAAVAADPALATALVVDLDVDANRNGSVEDTDDEDGEDRSGEARGALMLANCDRDGSEPLDSAVFDAHGRPGFESRVVESPADAEDLAPVVLRRRGADDQSQWWLEMSADDARAVHVFAGRRAGAPLLLGDASARGGPVRVRVDDLVRGDADVELGIESLYLAGHRSDDKGGEWVFDGEIELRLVAAAAGSGSPIGSDSVRLQVAPLLLLPSTLPARRIWIQSNDGSGALADAFGGVAEVVDQPGAEARLHRFFQDHVEVGYTAIPRAGAPAGRQAMHVALRTPLLPLPKWPEKALPAPGRGLYRWREPSAAFPVSASSMGGNIELLPPSPRWPLGRILAGEGIGRDLLDFFAAQRVGGIALQPAVVADVGWLRVGHIDEIVNFVARPTGATRPFKVVVADPEYALRLLKEGDAARGIRAPPQDVAVFVLGPQAAGRASNAIATGSDQLLFDGVSHGSIHCPSAAAIRDGERVTVHDGRSEAVFEFDFDGSTEAGTVPVRLEKRDLAADVSRRLRSAITARLDLVVALREADGTFILANTRFGTEGNRAITETVADPRFVALGMSGGEAESEGRDFTKHDWRLVRIYAGTGAGQVAAVTQRHRGFVNIYAPQRQNTVFRTTSVAVADPSSGAHSLQQLLWGQLTGAEYKDRWLQEPAGDSLYVVATESLTWHTRGVTGAWGFPTIMSMSELQRDESLGAFNRRAQARIDGVRSTIVDAMGTDPEGRSFLRDDGNASDDSLAGDDDDDFIRLPVLFVGSLAGDGSIEPGSAEALAPNLVNFQSADSRHIVFPRTHFGPPVEVSGHDLFEWPVRLAIGESATFLDEWITYHDRVGEVHCATAAERELPAEPWWERVPGGLSGNRR